MLFRVSGAPLTATIVLRLLADGRLTSDTVDIRFRAEENWNRLLIWICALCEVVFPSSVAVAVGSGVTTSPFETFHFIVSSAVFSIGSPTMPSSKRTKAWAAASVKVVDREADRTSMSVFADSALNVNPSVSVCQIPVKLQWSARICTPCSGDSLHNQILASQSTGLVKAAYINATSVGDSKRLGAEDS